MRLPIPQDPILSVDNLQVHFHTLRGVVHALESVSFQLGKQETMGLVGESGCGKSVTARAILRLIDPPGRVVGGRVLLEGEDLLQMDEAALRKKRGNEVSMIMQEPQVSLNPVYRVGAQVAETILIHHQSSTRKGARKQAIEMLAEVGIPDPGTVARRYPHELSGGMAQRVMIAMMLVTRPKLLIADEPTSALDVTIQAQILELMKNLTREFQTSVLMITHDLGVMAETCDRVAIMYAGKIVESGRVRSVLKNPRHPYTRGLLSTIPDNVKSGQTLYSIKGNVPSLLTPAVGCRFAQRCEHVMAHCETNHPPLYEFEGDHRAACFLLDSESNSASKEHPPGTPLSP